MRRKYWIHREREAKPHGGTKQIPIKRLSDWKRNRKLLSLLLSLLAKTSAENCYQKEWLSTSEKLSCLYSGHMETLREPGDFSLWKKKWGKISSMTRFGGKKKKNQTIINERERKQASVSWRKVKKSFEKRKGIKHSKTIRNQGS